MHKYRTITIEGIKFDIRALTRGEIKKLKEYGYSYFGCVPSMDNAIDAQDKCLETQLDKEQMMLLDDCSAKSGTKIWTEILKETYGAADEEKNSQSTSSGTRTENA